MNIKCVEQETGITKQNIRFYEKQGLLTPKRNKENEYREYSEEDIKTLKTIKILRKLQMPVEQIKRVLDQEEVLVDALKEHQKRLEEETEQLKAAIVFCKELEKETIEQINPDTYLVQMEQEEKKGNVFADILNDFKTIAKEERKKSFSFMPNTMVQNEREFTQALVEYANENKCNLTITKEGMYPEFEIDGVEYEANRRFSRFGAIVECNLKHPEEVEDKNISSRKRKIFKIIAVSYVPLFLFFYLFLTRIGSGSVWVAFFFAFLVSVTLGAIWKFLPFK